MTCRDWRGAAATVIEPLFQDERRRWTSVLKWDTTRNWLEVETARRAGLLPGFLIEDATGVTGWSFQLLVRGCLQVGAVVSGSQTATAALLDEVLASTEAAAASSVMVFAPDVAPGLMPALAARGFATERYWYMERGLDGLPSPPALGRGWVGQDTRPVADLLRRAYAPFDAARPFAREGDQAAWLEYVDQLTTTTGCGVFGPALSVVVPDAATTGVSAVVLVSTVGPSTGHVAQVAVDPVAQGTGLGRRAVLGALANLRRNGCDRATLLVGDRNEGARRLYQGLGFVETAAFVSAALVQPRRSTSAALATGGARTFR
jgi:ribosomal protein S18 acetylase RimI-like enzyme